MKTKHILFLIFDFIILSVLLFVFKLNANIAYNDVLNITKFSFFISLSLIILSFLKNKNILDFYKIFLILYIIYTFGLVYLRYVFGYEYQSITMYIDIYFSSMQLYKSILYSTYFLIILDIGYNFYLCFHNNENIKIDFFQKLDNNKNNIKILKKLGLFLFIVSCGFALSELLNTINLVSVLGYRGQIENVSYGISSLTTKIASYFILSIYILIICNKDNKKNGTILMIIGTLYSIALIFLGRRGLPLLEFLGLLIVYSATYNKINFKTILQYTIIIFIISTAISVIRDNRNEPLSTWITTLNVEVKNKIIDNPINQSIYEMGLGIYPITSAMELVPNTIKPLYGKTYLYSIINALNFNFGTSKKNPDRYNIGVLVSKTTGFQYGSSFLEEIYCNFEWWGIAIAPFFGYFIALFSHKFYHQKNLLKKILQFYLFIQFIWCLKNVLYNMPRLIVLYYLFVLILYQLIIKRKRKEILKI